MDEERVAAWEIEREDPLSSERLNYRMDTGEDLLAMDEEGG